MNVLGVVLLVVLASVCFVGLMSYNGIIARKAKVQKAWCKLLTCKTLMWGEGSVYSLERTGRVFEQIDSSILSELEALEKQVAMLNCQTIRGADFQSVLTLSFNAKHLILSAAKVDPELADGDLYNLIVDRFLVWEETVTEYISNYNQNVESFNAGIKGFPSAIVNDLFNKECALPLIAHEESVGA